MTTTEPPEVREAPETTQPPRELNNALIMVSVQFLPVTSWPALEQCRERHERALDEYRAARLEESRIAARHKADRAQEVAAAASRVLDAEPAVDQAASEDARRHELAAIGHRLAAASLAARNAVFAALRLVEAHGEWLEEIVSRRAAAEAERDELLARAGEAGTRAHGEDHMARWLTQAATSATPQPFRDAELPPAPPATVAEVFATAEAGWAA